MIVSGCLSSVWNFGDDATADDADNTPNDKKNNESDGDKKSDDEESDDVRDRNEQLLDDAGLTEADKAAIIIPYAQSSTEYKTVDTEDYALTYYVNDLTMSNTQVLMEYGSTDELKNSYIYGNERIAKIEYGIDSALANAYFANVYDSLYSSDSSSNDIGGISSYYMYDGRGSVAQLINEHAELKASYTYDAYGNITYGSNTYESFYGYNAEETSPVTGLEYLRARYYDSEIGRFNTIDSYLGNVSNPESLNRYAYVENNPVNMIDPSGHWPSFKKAKKALKAVGTMLKVTTELKVQTAINSAKNKINKVKKFVKDNAGTLIGAAIGVAVGTALILAAPVAAVAVAATSLTAMTTIAGAQYDNLRKLYKYQKEDNQVQSQIDSDKKEYAKTYDGTGNIPDIDYNYLRDNYIPGYTSLPLSNQEYKRQQIIDDIILLEHQHDELCRKKEYVKKRSEILNIGFETSEVIFTLGLQLYIDSVMTKPDIPEFDIPEPDIPESNIKNDIIKPDITENISHSQNVEGLNKIKEHLYTDVDGMDFEPNKAMLSELETKLQNGEQLTGAYKDFYEHELTEQLLMEQGYDYNTAHNMALEMHNAQPQQLYSPDVIKQYPKWFNKSDFEYWNIKP